MGLGKNIRQEPLQSEADESAVAYDQNSFISVIQTNLLDKFMASLRYLIEAFHS